MHRSNVGPDAFAVVMISLVMLTAFVTKTAASVFPSAESKAGTYLPDYPASPPDLPPTIETAQATQSQNLQPGYVPQLPTQETPHQTLTLPQAAPQSLPPPVLELPRSQGQTGSSRELPIKPAPQSAIASISITATDGTGRWIQDLHKQDLTLYEDGIERSILSLQRDVDTPASIGIVVDTSGSMSWKLAAAEAALQHFIRTLNPDDQFFLIAFSDRAFLLQNFTNNPADLNRAIGLLNAQGRTALYDAVVEGLEKVQQGQWPKKALLVITDGMDNASSNSLDNAIQAGRRGAVLIYTVGIGTTSSPSMAAGPMIMGPIFGRGLRFGGGFSRYRRGGEDERVDATTLQRLSDETGATTFVINPRVSDLSGLDSHFQSISAELREQYTLRYTSAGGGQPHKIRVDSLRPGMEVRAPKWTGNGSSGSAG